MKNKIKNLHVNYSEYCYFDYLSDSEAIEYFFQLFEGQHTKENLDLNGFFEQINEEYNIQEEPLVQLKKDIPDHYNRVDIMIDDEYLMIESNSLKAVRLVISKFMESGYVMSRDSKSEKMFKQDKTYRYLRVFNIIGQIPGISLS
tara:strand:- start:29 stop:463 length:435 start_codon:yes stop_codon:yes gene_type:complete